MSALSAILTDREMESLNQQWKTIEGLKIYTTVTYTLCGGSRSEKSYAHVHGPKDDSLDPEYLEQTVSRSETQEPLIWTELSSKPLLHVLLEQLPIQIFSLKC